ncbi:Type II secretion system (T2SS), protein F [uncultured archaeon]|nr:Type II secretion system (T2SS), protein F [uncultured archaeon]
MPNPPFLPISYKDAEKLLRPLDPVIGYFSALFPLLGYDLGRIDDDITPKQYFIGALLSSSVILLLSVLGMGGLMLAARPEMLTDSNIAVIIVFSAVLALSFFTYTMLIPRWKAQRRSAMIERDLLFAVRHMTVQTNAGVPLFASLVSISEERGELSYGMVSKEFKRIIKEVEGGKDIAQALDDSAARTPSKYYERIMWQLANASRTGVPVNEALNELIDYLAEEQRIALRNYGAQLSPLALLYLLTTIVGPTLGIIFLMVISTLVELPVTSLLFVALLLIIAVAQIFFLGLIGSRRPTLAI